MAVPSVDKKTTIILSAIVVILLGIMIFVNRVRLAKLLKKPTTQSDITQIQQQSESTELDSIEKDLNDTDVENVDKEVKDIEYEIDQVYN